MIDFIKTCEKARKELVQIGCKNGIAAIGDIGDRWLFCGIPGENSGPYGNCPIAIDKKTGNAKEFSIFANMELFYSATPIEVPEQFYVTE